MCVYNRSGGSLTALQNMPNIPLHIITCTATILIEAGDSVPLETKWKPWLTRIYRMQASTASLGPTPGAAHCPCDIGCPCAGFLTCLPGGRWYSLPPPFRCKDRFLTSFKHLIKHGHLASPQLLFSLFSSLFCSKAFIAF